jgi:hypothetical protein
MRQTYRIHNYEFDDAILLKEGYNCLIPYLLYSEDLQKRNLPATIHLYCNTDTRTH